MNITQMILTELLFDKDGKGGIGYLVDSIPKFANNAERDAWFRADTKRLNLLDRMKTLIIVGDKFQLWIGSKDPKAYDPTKWEEVTSVVRGASGPQGPKGDKGDKGDTGSQGPIGPIGPEGKQGVAGPQGPQGPKGDEGPRGNQGMRGDKGDKGDPGTYDVSKIPYNNRDFPDLNTVKKVLDYLLKISGGVVPPKPTPKIYNVYYGIVPNLDTYRNDVIDKGYLTLTTMRDIGDYQDIVDHGDFLDTSELTGVQGKFFIAVPKEVLKDETLSIIPYGTGGIKYRLVYLGDETYDHVVYSTYKIDEFTYGHSAVRSLKII